MPLIFTLGLNDGTTEDGSESVLHKYGGFEIVESSSVAFRGH